MLKKAGRNVNEVELFPNGEWRPIVPKDESVSDDDEVPLKKVCSATPNNHLSVAPSATNLAATAPAQVPDDDVIVLGDSDDEVKDSLLGVIEHTSTEIRAQSTWWNDEVY